MLPLSLLVRRASYCRVCLRHGAVMNPTSAILLSTKVLCAPVCIGNVISYADMALHYNGTRHCCSIFVYINAYHRLLDLLVDVLQNRSIRTDWVDAFNSMERTNTCSAVTSCNIIRTCSNMEWNKIFLPILIIIVR